MRRFTAAQDQWLSPAGFLPLPVACHFIFGQLFPTRHGAPGHGYSRVLPDLLGGHFWK